MRESMGWGSWDGPRNPASHPEVRNARTRGRSTVWCVRRSGRRWRPRNPATRASTRRSLDATPVGDQALDPGRPAGGEQPGARSLRERPRNVPRLRRTSRRAMAMLLRLWGTSSRRRPVLAEAVNDRLSTTEAGHHFPRAHDRERRPPCRHAIPIAHRQLLHPRVTTPMCITCAFTRGFRIRVHPYA